MKKHNKTLICAFAATIAILAAAPAAAHAAEDDPISTAPATTTISTISTTATTTQSSVTTTASTTKSETTTSSTTAAPVTTTASVTTKAASVPTEEGWYVNDEGKIYYYRSDSTYYTGVHEIDDELYLFSKNGVLKTGWRTVGGKRRYYDPETGKPCYGWLEYCGRKYYLTKNGKATGLFTDDDGKQYRFSEEGALISEAGFFKDGDSFYYGKEDGTLATGEIKIEGFPYVFDENGKELTGWQEIDGNKFYYYPETGKAAEGLSKIEDKFYFVSAESGMTTGVVEIGGAPRIFGDDGVMLLGRQLIKGKKYYFYEDSSYAKGLCTVDGTNYVFGEDGVLAEELGLTTVDGDTYFHDEKGVAINGRQKVNGDFYYFGDDFKMFKGIIKLDGKTYYFGEDGKRTAGLITYKGDTYYFDEETAEMKTGRLKIDGNKYYFAEDGKMTKSSWATIDGKKYYFGKDGVMASGITEIDGEKYCFSSETGQIVTGRLIVDGKKYYFGEDGKMQFGMQKIDDSTYYFDEDGVMYTGWLELDGKKYYFLPDTGAMARNMVVDDTNLLNDGTAAPLVDSQIRAKDVLKKSGTSLHGIYSYICNNNKYQYMEATRSLDEIQKVGWSYFATYMMDNRYGVCYYLAAITDILFKQAGYQTRIVYGTGRATSDHYWNQVLVNGQWLNYDTCNGFEGVTEAYLKTANNPNSNGYSNTGIGYTIKAYVITRYY